MHRSSVYFVLLQWLFAFALCFYNLWCCNPDKHIIIWSLGLLTWLYDPGLGPQVGQVHIGLPAIDDGVGVLAGPVGRGPVCHGDLKVKQHINLMDTPVVQSNKLSAFQLLNSISYVPELKASGLQYLAATLPNDPLMTCTPHTDNTPHPSSLASRAHAAC